MADTNEYREQRLASMQTLKEMGYEPYGCKYDHVDLKVVRETFEEGKGVRVAGRLLMIRRMGKMNFCTMNDGTDRFQLIFKRDELSERRHHWRGGCSLHDAERREVRRRQGVDDACEGA